MTVKAIVTGNRDCGKPAAMLDPRAAAELSLDEISDFVDR